MGALTAALAGCTGDDDQSTDDSPTDDGSATETPTDDSSPADTPADETPTDTFAPADDLPYGQWLTTAQSGLFFAYANLDNVPQNAVGGSMDSSEPPVDDPLALYPLAVGGALVGLGQLSLSFAGLAQAVSPDAPSDSTVSEVTTTNRVIIAEGSFATDQLDGRLTEATPQTFGVAHEQTGTVRGYDQYEPAEVPESVSNPPAVAVTEETVVVAPDTSRLEQTIAAGEGDQSRVFESNDSATALLEQAGTGDLVVGQLGSIPDEQLIGDGQLNPDPQFRARAGENVVAAVDFEASGDTFESLFALAAADLGEERTETIETSFGTAAIDGSRSVEASNDRVVATGTYGVEQLSGDTSDQELSQARAAELVSPDTLRFQYEPPRGEAGPGQLWVTVTEDTEAAAIRVETDSGGANELEPQNGPITADTSIVAPVDPAGDTVTVFAVDDQGAAGKLVTQSVPTEELSESTANQAVPEDALAFSYEPPEAGNIGELTVEVVTDTDADTLVAQPQEGPRAFTARAGSLNGDDTVGAGATLETGVEPEGDEVVVYATVDGATGEVARWQGPE